MPLFDKPLEELAVYDPPTTRAPNFDPFWTETLSESIGLPIDAELDLIDYPAIGVTVYEVSYTGFKGARISAWYLVPDGAGPWPALVQYHGYSGSKGEPHNYLVWALQGYAVLAVDVRGQSGKTPDPTQYSEGHISGWMTQGIMDPYEYYYRAVYVDCVRAIDFLCARPEVDSSHIGVLGTSQGGGLTLAVAALDARPVVAMPEVPYLCHFQRAVDMAARMPYLEISNYIRRWPKRAEQVWNTLSYFDNLNLAERIRCPVLMNVGLLDDVCPPSTIYAVYNKIKSPKEMRVFPYHNHEGVDALWEDKFRWAHYYLQGVNWLNT
jgi:cephalosporin-C deacetylase